MGGCQRSRPLLAFPLQYDGMVGEIWLHLTLTDHGCVIDDTYINIRVVVVGHDCVARWKKVWELFFVKFWFVFDNNSVLLGI